jgi:hypothetical protein
MLQQIDIARLMKNRCARMSNPSFGFKVIDVPVPHGKLLQLTRFNSMRLGRFAPDNKM